LSEGKRFKRGFTGVANPLYLANVGDKDALYAFLRFEGDSFFLGGLKPIDTYKREFRMGHNRVTELLSLWKNAQEDFERVSRDFRESESQEVAGTSAKPERVSRDFQESSERVLLSSTETETETETDKSPDAERLTILFADTLASAAEEHGISRRKQARPPKAWFTEMDRLLRLDGIEAEVVESVLLWAITESDFWGTGSGQGVLQSVPKLRKHWDIIASQRAEAQPRERFDVAKRVLAASEGGKRGHQRKGAALRLLAGQLDGVRQGSQ
jgi:hypothetical protein